MKKVFLLIGIAAFSSASAQQNDLFDIQKHIQKKIVKDKEKIGIKAPLISKCYNWWGRPVVKNSYRNSIPNFILPNGDRVITLPLDNMPCVQPDISFFRSMPNPGYDGNPYSNYLLSMRQRKPGQIPNGALPFRIIDSK